ncbi:MAG: glutathione S-transferase family protein [Azospirillaceae bacterium]
MIRLLGRSTSGNVQKVLFLLEELGIDYQREDYGRQFDNTQTADYLALNPNAKVPTLIDGDLVIWESNTILRYLASKSGSELYPSDLGERSQVERWMDWLLATLNTAYVAVFKDSKNAPADRAAIFGDMAKEVAGALKILDGALDGRDWIAGEAVSLADIALAPIVHRCVNFPIDLPSIPNVDRWIGAIRERPAFQKATGG